MKRILSIIILSALFFTAFLRNASALEVNAPAPDFTLKDSNGTEHSLSDYKGKYVILEWMNFECPFVRNHYDSGNMQYLQKYVTKNDGVWLSINSSAQGKQGYFDNAEINKRIKEEGASPTAYLVDSDGKVGRLYGAKTTPQMFLIDPEGVLVYQGAIDSIPSFDKEDVAKAEKYLFNAFNAAMEGQPIFPSETKSYGCSVKY